MGYYRPKHQCSDRALSDRDPLGYKEVCPGIEYGPGGLHTYFTSAQTK